MEYGASDAAVGKAIKGRGYVFPTIYDVGGSNGAWTYIMSKVFPESRFELFEPLANIDPSYQKGLVHFVAHHPKARMNPVAIGDCDGKIDIHITNDPSGSTTLLLGSPEGMKTTSVPMRSIDSLVQKQDCPPPNLIKIDIQGGEFAALKGAVNTLPNVEFLLLETWLQRGYGKSTPLLHELIHFLAPQNFLPYEFSDVYRGANGATVSIDVWFINVAKSKEDYTF